MTTVANIFFEVTILDITAYPSCHSRWTAQCGYPQLRWRAQSSSWTGMGHGKQPWPGEHHGRGRGWYPWGSDQKTVQEQCPSPLSGGDVGIFKGAFFTFTIPLMYPWRSAKSILRSLAAPFLCLTWALNTDPAPFLCPLITRPMVSWNRAVYVSCRVDMWTHALIPVRINYQIESCTFRFKRVKRYKPDNSTPIRGILN